MSRKKINKLNNNILDTHTFANVTLFYLCGKICKKEKHWK